MATMSEDVPITVESRGNSAMTEPSEAEGRSCGATNNIGNSGTHARAELRSSL